MVLVLRRLLVVIRHVGVHPPKAPNQRLLVARVLSTSDLHVEPVQHLKTITEIVLHRSGAWLVVKQVKNLSEIHGRPVRSPVPN
uniref:AC5 n=1 Tax=Cleome leaf crumple virus TaxID=666144 RepID=E0Z5Q3_9GEMI|nr:AC5 [Cleome leaf crumple virus]